MRTYNIFEAFIKKIFVKSEKYTKEDIRDAKIMKKALKMQGDKPFTKFEDLLKK